MEGGSIWGMHCVKESIILWKLSLYHKAGVREYWIVDPMQKSVIVYNLEHEGGAALHFFSEKVKSGILDGLALDFGEWQ